MSDLQRHLAILVYKRALFLPGCQQAVRKDSQQRPMGKLPADRSHSARVKLPARVSFADSGRTLGLRQRCWPYACIPVLKRNGNYERNPRNATAF